MSEHSAASSDTQSIRDLIGNSYGHITYPDRSGEPRRVATSHFRVNLLPHIPADRTAAILDVGCGSGQFISFLRQLGYSNVGGIDAAEDQVERARAAGLGSVEQADAAEYLSSRPNSFDVITAIDVIEHLTRSEAIVFLQTAAMSLRPPGRLVLHTVNASAPFFGRIRYGDLTHETAFNVTSLEQAFRVAGLDCLAVVGVRPTGRLPLQSVRRALVAAFRVIWLVYVIAETGVLRGHILAESLVAVASRPAQDGRA
jgi:SAM-dependent methyltransferase